MPSTARNAKQPICKCGNSYTKYNALQNKCIPCLIEKGKQLKAKAERKEWKRRKDKLKTRSDYAEDTKRAFHEFVRIRDLYAGFTCICCLRPLVPGEYDAGHFRSVGSSPHLRFDERNVHSQTKHCNRWKGGRYFEYEKGLRARMGDSFVDELKADQMPRKHTIDDLKELRKFYKAKTKELLKNR